MIPDGTIFGEEPNHNLSAAKLEKQPSRSFGRKVARVLGFEKPQPLGRRDPLSRRPGVYIRSAEAGPPVLPPDLIESIKNGSALRPREDQPPTPEEPQKRSVIRKLGEVVGIVRPELTYQEKARRAFNGPGVRIRSAEGALPIVPDDVVESIKNRSALEPRPDDPPLVPFDI